MTLDFQSLIFKLQEYWQAQGCLIWQPYHTEVGAGTMNPATFLRTLGPEPWNVAYVEPSIRPDDGRYGENPNRLYQHTQFQVIIKPDRGNSLELYLGSLEAIGVDLQKHDIRFVEDNWAQPVISAWGLGWEVWMDGLEITQFTYFQQVGGLSLDPVSVELTYGLERIAMALQGVRDFKDLRWSQTTKYGDVLLQNEQETCKYAFELANVDRLRQMFDLYEAEAKEALKHFQVIPAHDYVLKCSHTFNILDTRGAIGVTERAGFFRRMRALARGVAETYVEQRQRLEYPWLEDGKQKVGRLTKSAVTPTFQPSSHPAPFLLEIGTEELPAGDLEDALAQMRTSFPALLAELRLAHGAVEVLGTPRRLVVYVQDLAPSQPDLEEAVKGPPASRAFDSGGAPTKAAEGFARSKGVEVADLQVRTIDGGEYVVAVVRQKGRPTANVLTQALPQWIASLAFGKSMRWNHTNVAFSRPIRWLLALHGETVIPFEYAGLTAECVTRGLRFIEPLEIRVTTPTEYFAALESQGILLDPAIRQASIETQVKQIAAEAGGEIQPDPALLAEVTHLVEAPAALRGDFDLSHLALPREVLIAVMKKHQRYFPLEKVLSDAVRSTKDDCTPHPAPRTLLPHFVIVANKPAGAPLAAIKQGNEDVVRARFADAAYFVREDLKTPLEDFVPKLDKLTFQENLGSMLAKTRRIGHLVGVLAPLLNLSPEETFRAARAAKLCKADLATQMVIDMTSLQGVMGREYALACGEPPEIANAIFEHYLPRFAGDSAPRGKPGLAVGLADRLDSLVGLFAAGLIPSGNKDPFALRRAALGLVNNLLSWQLDFDLRPALQAAAENLPIPASPEAQAECLVFITERLRNLLLEEGQRYDIVDAVLAAQGYNPARAAQAVRELTAWTAQPDWNEILPAYARCVRITRATVSDQLPALDPALFAYEAEQQLYTALQTAETAGNAPGSVDGFLHAFLPLIPAINRFFEDVLVMDEDQALRANRLALLQRIAALAAGVADLSRLEGF